MQSMQTSPASSESHTLDPLTLSYVDPVWLQSFPLNEDTVLDYFANSQFYDRTCNNEVIKMQRMDRSQLPLMTGVEYVVSYSGKDPGVLYCIVKQYRHSPTSTEPLQAYYIIQGSIYQAPDLYSLVNSRLATSLYHVQQAFRDSQNLEMFHPAHGYFWKKTLESLSANSEADSDPSLEEHSSLVYPSSMPFLSKTKQNMAREMQYQVVDQLLVNLYRKYPPIT